MVELLAVRGLRVDFATDRGPAQVLDGINLDIAAGEVVGLVGESGCGKTTLGRVLVRLLAPTSGVIAKRNGEAGALVEQDEKLTIDCVNFRSPVFNAHLVCSSRGTLQLSFDELKRPAATFSWKVAAGFEIFLRLLFFTSPGDAHKLSRSRSP